ncbi:unnamed protein product [Musa acuminata subsp. burmannicoides]
MVKAKGLLGSKPAKCEMKCTKCAHCEAVRVPIVPVNRTETRECFRSTAFGIDYSSNYKSMNWKRKCGDMILNHKMPKRINTHHPLSGFAASTSPASHWKLRRRLLALLSKSNSSILPPVSRR